MAKIIFLLVFLCFLVVGGFFWYTRYGAELTGMLTLSPREIVKRGVEDISGLGSAMFGAIEDAARLPETNPFSKVETNPFAGAYKNPFE